MCRKMKVSRECNPFKIRIEPEFLKSISSTGLIFFFDPPMEGRSYINMILWVKVTVKLSSRALRSVFRNLSGRGLKKFCL